MHQAQPEPLASHCIQKVFRFIGVMEKKMEITVMELYRIWGVWVQGLGLNPKP